MGPNYCFHGSDAAPAVVVRVHGLEVLFSTDEMGSPGAPPQSFSPVRGATKASKPIGGSPGRPASPFRPGITEATYKRGLQVLRQHQVDTFTKGSLYADYSKSGSPMGGKEGGFGAGRQQQRHPETFETMAIPNCAVCLRRVRGLSNLSSGLAGCSDIPVCRSFTSDARLSFDELNSLRTADGLKGAGSEEADCSVRCLPCHIYHTVANSTGSSRNALKGGDGNMRKLGRCCACGMSENIWMCLQCGHTGCGRYTAQHAKAHHQEHPTHNLSLELATGRIWNYHTDTFCYYEVSDIRSPQDPLYYASDALFSPLSAPIAPDSSRYNAEPAMAVGGMGPSSPPQCKKFMTPSFDAAQSGLPGNGAHSAGGGGGIEGISGLDSVTAGKITAMMGNYERLLEAQLQDQQLYFEKLLARETVRALEQSYQPQQSGEKATGGSSSSATSLKKGKSQKNSARALAAAETSAGAEEKSSLEPALGNETCPIAAPFLTQSSAFQQAASELTDAEVLRGMEEVEALKLEISAMEAEYRAVLEEIRAADDLVRLLKKDNDGLIRAQKELVGLRDRCRECTATDSLLCLWLLQREQEADWKQKTEQFRLQATAQVRLRFCMTCTLLMCGRITPSCESAGDRSGAADPGPVLLHEVSDQRCDCLP